VGWARWALSASVSFQGCQVLTGALRRWFQVGILSWSGGTSCKRHPPVSTLWRFLNKNPSASHGTCIMRFLKYFELPRLLVCVWLRSLGQLAVAFYLGCVVPVVSDSDGGYRLGTVF
jgi:hypothetical protein